MWIEKLSANQAITIFGSEAEKIVTLSKAVLRGKPTKGDTLDNYGSNGIAAGLFMQSWKNIPWRRSEATSFPDELRSKIAGTKSYSDSGMYEKSIKWDEALEKAGIRERSGDSFLSNVWYDALKVVEKIGGPNAGIIAGAASSELAQVEKDIHFFLDLMPFVRMGYWPCGWDDNKDLPYLYAENK